MLLQNWKEVAVCSGISEEGKQMSYRRHWQQDLVSRLILHPGKNDQNIWPFGFENALNERIWRMPCFRDWCRDDTRHVKTRRDPRTHAKSYVKSILKKVTQMSWECEWSPVWMIALLQGIASCLKYQSDWLHEENAPSCSEWRMDLLDRSWRLVNVTCAWTGAPPPPPPPNFLNAFKEFHTPFHAISLTFVTVPLLSCKP